MKSPSIRHALLFRCGGGVGVLLCFLSVLVYLLVRHSLHREIDKAIRQTAEMLANQVELENYKVTFEWQEGLASSDAMVLEGLFQIWDEQTGETTRAPALRSGDLPKFDGGNSKPDVRDIHLPNGDRGRALGLRIHPFALPEEMERMRISGKVIDPKSLSYTSVVARDIEPMQRTMEHLRYMLASGTLLTLALGFTLINRVIRSSLKPIGELKRQMDDRAEHQLDARLNVPGELPVELAGLAENFDALLSRVAALRERERDFLRHAAHELRTPIAGLRATTELALSQDRTTGEYREHLTVCQITAMELGELIQRLSALARIGQAASPVVMEPVDVGPVVMECTARFQQLRRERGLEFKMEFPHEPLTASAEGTLLRIILNNLLDNAVSYATPGGTIRIHGGFCDGQVEIRISNPTPKFPDPLDRLFEPLFRHEPSRSDAGGHLGIGLTLSLEAARATNATLLARRTDEGCIEFVLKLERGFHIS